MLSEDVDIDWQTFEGETALLLACRKGRAACVEKLIENGANIDLPTNELVTPLHEGEQFFFCYFAKQHEPPHDKTNKMTVCPAKSQISLGIRPV